MSLNVDNLSRYQAEFAKHLVEERYGVLSVKSYLADLRDYYKWANAKASRPNSRLSNKNQLSAYFSQRALQQYFEQCEKDCSHATIKRRFAGLCRFLKYAVTKRWLDRRLFDFLQNLADKYLQALKNNENLVERFISDLAKKETSKNSLRGYRTDISEFLVIN